MTTDAAFKAWASRRRARARSEGVPVFTTPALVLNVMDAKLRVWAIAWVRFCRGQGARPAWSADDEHQRRTLELRIARLGIVDPEGFGYGAVTRVQRKRKFKGVFRGVAGQLAEDRKRLRYGGWHG